MAIYFYENVQAVIEHLGTWTTQSFRISSGEGHAEFQLLCIIIILPFISSHMQNYCKLVHLARATHSNHCTDSLMFFDE